MRHALWMVSLLLLAGCTDADTEDEQVDDPMPEESMAQMLYLHRSGACMPGSEVVLSMNDTMAADDECPALESLSNQPMLFVADEGAKAHMMGAMVNGSLTVSVAIPSALSGSVALLANDTVVAVQSMPVELIEGVVSISLNMTLQDNVSEGSPLALRVILQSTSPVTIVMNGESASRIHIA